MLVELRLVEQRHQAVLEVLNDGASVVEVACRSGVAARRCSAGCGSTRRRRGGYGRPQCQAVVVSAPDFPGGRSADRGDAPGASGVGARTILFWLKRDGVEPLPGRTSVERCLVRHRLVTPQARKRKRSDYKRWERSRAMELWQMDIAAGSA